MDHPFIFFTKGELAQAILRPIFELIAASGVCLWMFVLAGDGLLTPRYDDGLTDTLLKFIAPFLIVFSFTAIVFALGELKTRFLKPWLRWREERLTNPPRQHRETHWDDG